jgi:hypothetical protein
MRYLVHTGTRATTEDLSGTTMEVFTDSPALPIAGAYSDCLADRLPRGFSTSRMERGTEAGTRNHMGGTTWKTTAIAL